MVRFTLLTCIIFFIGCTGSQPDQEEKSRDESQQKFPEGVEKSTYFIRYADGSAFQGMRIEPPFWWVDMPSRKLEILLYDQDIQGAQVKINYPGIRIAQVYEVENPNYLFIDLEINPSTQPGVFQLELVKGEDKRSYSYELKSRERYDYSLAFTGLDGSDIIYLIMPDRFANGDPDNDSVEGMHQTGVDRSKMYFRHGGDIQGIIDRLDYLVDLGITALWLNPVQENDQPYESYHGYAITDHYNIDRRLGSNEKYKELVSACHQRGIKVIMDIIHNHVGDQHYFILDLPDFDWIHQPDSFIRTTYRDQVLMDPYASEADKDHMSNGWFDNHMPDLNQKHPRLATYLIQNNIWWLEYAGINGYRIDTYAYPDQHFMSDWGKAMLNHYPEITLFAETWVHGSPNQAWFTMNNNMRKDFSSFMPAVTDFQLYYAMAEALNTPQGWTEGAARLYTTLSHDFLYQDPYRNVTFLDNHDLDRFLWKVGNHKEKFKTGLNWLMTIRGIPMLYYGTEINMSNPGHPDGLVREDFPGGWPDDTVDKFSRAGRTNEEQTTFEHIQKLLSLRREYSALHSGKLTQYVPEKGLYTYFRYDHKDTIMIIANTGDKHNSVSLGRFDQFIPPGTTLINLLDDTRHDPDTSILLQAYESRIMKKSK
jgi:neopullulanase